MLANFDFTQLMEGIISLASVLITAVLVPFIKSKMDNTKQATMAEWVKVAVSAAEQIYNGPGRGEEKKDYVLDFLFNKGFRFDVESVNVAIDALIEASVRELCNTNTIDKNV